MGPVMAGTTLMKNYIGGKWVEAECSGHIDITNPSTGEVIAESPLSTTAETNRAIAAAAEAYRTWRTTPVARRVAPLFKLAQMLRDDEEKLARCLTRENGKSLTDARAELKRAFENIEVACGMPVMQQGDKLIGGSFDIDGEVLRLPIGVFGMIAPFNFPAMVPFWFIPYAIATGNTFVLKTSKQVPMTMQLITQYMEEAGIPDGVFNVVNGNSVVADALMSSQVVKGVSLVGSTPTCRIVAEKCAKTNKRFQAMGGAKNHLVAMPDAKIFDVIRNMTTSCYGCAGQRCMASSAIVAVEEIYDEICERFVEDSKNTLTANPLDPRYEEEPLLMGPVISGKAKEAILGLIEDGVQEGATLAPRWPGRHGGGLRERLLHRPHGVYGRQAGNEDPQDGDLRTGRRHHEGEGSRRRHLDREQPRVRQRGVDLHTERLLGAQVQAGRRVWHDRREHRYPSAGRLSPVRGHEVFPVGRHQGAGQGDRELLHGRQDHH